jgi:flagellar capping protein FliD
VINDQIFGVGEVGSLAELGVSIDEFGKLAFDRTKLEDRYAEDPESVTNFFANEDRGFAKKVDDIVETLAGANNDSLLLTRFVTLTSQVEDFQERVTFLTERLDRSRESLLNEFYRLESLIAKIQANQTAISAIQYISPDGSSG